MRMSLADLDAALVSEAGATIPSDTLAEWVVGQRWFGSKSRDFAQFNVLDVVVLEQGPPLLALLLLEARLHAGTHELYQLPIVTRALDDALPESVIAAFDGAVLCDALLDVRDTSRLAALMGAEAQIERDDTLVRFRWEGDEAPPPADAPARLMGVEQSNTTTVFDERLALKVFRRIEAGTNPEVEMLRFLDTHGFAQIAPLEGCYTYHGELLDGTLGVMQRYIPHAGDGWTLAVSALDEGRGPEFLARLHDLGAVTGRMHAVLGSDREDPDFAPEEPSEEHVALISATIDERIERGFIELPDLEALAPIAGRAEELRDRVTLLSHHGAGGRLIRCHG